MPKKKHYLSWLRKGQKKQGATSPSTTMAEGSHASSLQQSQQDIQSAYSLHRSIRTLPYDCFVQIITGEELKPLIISGTPPVDELVSAWDNISDEYSNAIKSGKSKNVFAAYKKYIRIDSKMKMVDAALMYLTELYDEEIATILHQNGYRLITPEPDREKYLKQIRFVRSQAGSLVVMLNQAVAAYKLLAPDNEHKVERDYQSFIDELAILSKHQGYALRAKEITVLEYCAVINAYMLYVEANRKEAKNG
jgi:hypothetical protein